MKHRMLCLGIISCAFVFTHAQEKNNWSLDDCIQYALDNNIQLQQSRISLEESKVDIKTARAALFPSMSFSSGHNVTNRPYQENSNTVSGTEIISSQSKTTYNGNYGLNAQWTIWNGNKRINNIKQQKTVYEMTELNVRETENSLQEQIVQLFVQILYSQESIKINESTLELSKANYDRGVKLLKEGSISKVELAQLEAQVSNDNYQVVVAKNSFRDYQLQLKQLLELDPTTEFSLELPELSDKEILHPLPNHEEIYRQALLIRPEIKSGQLAVKNSQLGISIAKAGYFPTLSLSASTGSNTNSASEKSWANQMKYGWNNIIGFNISIPIFSNRQNKSAVEKAQLQFSNSRLELMNKEKELYQTIESLWMNAANAQQEYVAANSKLKSNQLSFNLVNEQFKMGMKNIIELLTEKNNLLSAKQLCVQAKYMAVLDRTLLNFYAGNKIEL